MKKHTLTTALILSLAVLFLSPPAARAEKKSKGASEALMRLIPKDAIFCVRVNNLQATLDSIDKFAQGLLPLPMKLAGFLEGDQWNNVEKEGSFALFALVLPGEAQQDNPLANIFVGVLVPITDYEKLLSESPDISQPDDKGISKAGGGHGPLVTKAGKFALLCWENDYDKLVEAKKLLANKTPGLRSAIAGADYKRAAGQPIWAYANIQVAKQTFCPFLSAKIEEIKKQFKMMGPGERGLMPDPDPVIDMYAAVGNVLADEIQYVSIAIDPGEDALNVIETVVAKEGTQLAEAFVAAPGGAKKNKLLGYLEDGAMMNLAFRANSPALKKDYIRSLDLLKLLGSASDDEINKLKEMMSDSFDAMGDHLAFSFSTEPDSLFVFKYALQVGDKEKFEKSLAQEIELMNSDLFTDLYKNFGMKMHVKVNRGADEYKGVSIDSAKLALTSTEPDSEYGKMIEAMYGDGFDYRWAIVDNLALYVVGGDVDAEIRELIDRVKAGGPKGIASEIESAQEALSGGRAGDFFGTFNYVRMLKMVSAMTRNLPGAAPMPEIGVESKSNLAFTGAFRNGTLTTQAALPKEHIRELVAAFMTMQAKMAEQQKKARIEPGETGSKPLFNGKDLTGWEPSGNAKWVVEDGLLIGTQGENNAPGDLFTTQTFKDFELTCTYRAEWPCNSGIWFRYQSPQKAYQADILEWKDPVCYSGTIYCPGKMFLSMNEDKLLVNRDGWNTMKVCAKGDHLQVWLNGTKVGDVHEGSTDAGKIGFQVHPGAEFGPMKIVVKEILIKGL